MKIRITSDSTCDLGENVQKRDIGILPLQVNLGDKAYRDGVNIVPEDIFKVVAETNVLPKTAAPSTSREPVLNRKLPFPSKLSAMLATVTRAIARVSRRDSTSRNAKKAIMEVATISKLFRSDALAELVRSKPSISRMGAAMSSTIMPMV